MAYKSLYRKYRPKIFDDVVGQDFIIKTLKNALLSNKISHAYLFSGSRGTGKTTIAKIFARMVNCLDLHDGVPCGKCEVCNIENTDDIPDIIEIDAASNNGVDEIRELKNKIKLVPTMCKYKVYIVDEVHMLSTGAFNALLKTLEEPPEHVIFILATTEPQKLPTTIISRCQRFDFRKISLQDITKRIKLISKEEGIELSEDAAVAIASMSDGALRDAIGLLDQISSFSNKKVTIEEVCLVGENISSETLIKLIEAYVEKNMPLLLEIVENIYLEGKDFAKLTESMLLFFRNVAIHKKAPNYFDSKDITMKKETIEVSEKIPFKSLKEIIHNIEELSKEIKASNYPRVLFEIFLLNSYGEAENVDEQKEEKQITIEEPVEKKEVDNHAEETVANIIANDHTNEIKINFESNESKKAMINNTIALANNKAKKNIEEILQNVDKYLPDKKHKAAATILKDASIAAASDDHVLLTYKYIGMVESNDKEITKISSLICDALQCTYKVVAITEDDWKKERPYYLDIKKKNGEIKLMEEIEENVGGGISNEKNDSTVIEAIDIFGKELIEME